ncbi:putative inactive tRNA-specific adenosine deaminase-like protein 3 [Intoshia linei]|uniref:Putative inactive tRNA-specific adenosine deaminase-like protein 3 n=1 Tax=Intoshia linei TaxID=1819745 RepID=A0A177B5A3_9BILA|nr:putative inactive tRNA-specific adenosine deaminase-like protein 3 [Intoshia linei]
MKIEAILDKKYTETDINLCKYVAIRIRKTKSVAILLNWLKGHVNLNNTLPKHFHQIRSIKLNNYVDILICSEKTCSLFNIYNLVYEKRNKNSIINVTDKNICRDIICIFCLNLPSLPVFTSIQKKMVSHYWPIYFKKDALIENKLVDNVFISQRNFIDKILLIVSSEYNLVALSNFNILISPANIFIFSPELNDYQKISQLHKRVPTKECNKFIKGHGFMDIVDIISKCQLTKSIQHEYKNETCIKLDEIFNNYLCTNMHAFFHFEPCIMCSMALLHSRIKTVFYQKKTSHGGLGSHVAIHSLPNTNHRFDVYHVKDDI